MAITQIVYGALDDARGKLNAAFINNAQNWENINRANNELRPYNDKDGSVSGVMDKLSAEYKALNVTVERQTALMRALERLESDARAADRAVAALFDTAISDYTGDLTFWEKVGEEIRGFIYELTNGIDVFDEVLNYLSSLSLKAQNYYNQLKDYFTYQGGKYIKDALIDAFKTISLTIAGVAAAIACPYLAPLILAGTVITFTDGLVAVKHDFDGYTLYCDTASGTHYGEAAFVGGVQNIANWSQHTDWGGKWANILMDTLFGTVETFSDVIEIVAGCVNPETGALSAPGAGTIKNGIDKILENYGADITVDDIIRTATAGALPETAVRFLQSKNKGITLNDLADFAMGDISFEDALDNWVKQDALSDAMGIGQDAYALYQDARRGGATDVFSLAGAVLPNDFVSGTVNAMMVDVDHYVPDMDTILLPDGPIISDVFDFADWLDGTQRREELLRNAPGAGAFPSPLDQVADAVRNAFVEVVTIHAE